MCWMWRTCKLKSPRNWLWRNIRNGKMSRYDEMCHMPKRNRPQSPWNNVWLLEKIVGAWLLSNLPPWKLLWWQLNFVSIISTWGVQIWPRPWGWNKGVSSPRPYHWEMLGASLESDCQSNLCWLFNSKSEDYAKPCRRIGRTTCFKQ